MAFDSNQSSVPFVSVDAAPKKPSRKASPRDVGDFDFDRFENFAGPGTSESEFDCARYDLQKAGLLDAAVFDVRGRFDREAGVWRNPNGSTVATAQLLQKLAATVSK